MRKLIGALIIAAALVTALASPSQALFGKDWRGYESRAVTFHDEVVRGGYHVVPTWELKKWLDQKKPMLVIDTMPYEKSYKENHIPGAKQFLFPIPEMKRMGAATQAKFLKLLGPDKNRLLVFYCGFTKCTRSHNGAMWAVKLGYKNVYRCPGGIMAWKQQDFPTAEVK